MSEKSTSYETGFFRTVAILLSILLDAAAFAGDQFAGSSSTF
jgi:hypothetical protein